MAGIKKEETPQAGFCSDHGGVLLFWCIKCSEWLCNDCSIVAHRSDTCAFLPWKRAVENFHTETEERVRQLDLKLTQSKSLVEKCQAWEASSLELLATVQTLGKSLRERKESIETLLKEGNETLSQLKSQLETRLVKSLQPDTSDAILLCHKSQEFGPRANKFLSDDDVTEKVSAAMTAMNRLDFTSYKAVEPFSPGVVDETLMSLSIHTLMAEYPTSRERGFLLKLDLGTFSLPLVLSVLGKDNIEHLENVAERLYIVTAVSREVRNYLVSKIKSISYRQACAYSIHSVTPFKVKVKGILYSVPSAMSTTFLPNVQQAISTALPVLKNVTLESDKWPNTNMNNGDLRMTCEADDLNELDRVLSTKGKHEGSSKWRLYEIPVGNGTRKLGKLEAGPLEETMTLSNISLVTGWKW